MKARIKWIENVCFVGESGSGHAVVMDGAPEGGGRNLGPRPMETGADWHGRLHCVRRRAHPQEEPGAGHRLFRGDRGRAGQRGPESLHENSLSFRPCRAAGSNPVSRARGSPVGGKVLLGLHHARQDAAITHDFEIRKPAPRPPEAPSALGLRLTESALLAQCLELRQQHLGEHHGLLRQQRVPAAPGTTTIVTRAAPKLVAVTVRAFGWRHHVRAGLHVDNRRLPGRPPCSFGVASVAARSARMTSSCTRRARPGHRCPARRTRAADGAGARRRAATGRGFLDRLPHCGRHRPHVRGASSTTHRTRPGKIRGRWCAHEVAERMAATRRATAVVFDDVRDVFRGRDRAA